MKLALAVATMLTLAGIVGFCVYFITLVRNAEDQMGSLDEKLNEVTKQPTVLLSTDGQVLYRVQTENRIYVKLEDVPPLVRNAVLAAEDKRFYQHGGYDPMGLGRAVMELIQQGRPSGGGSTLTMQLAKRLYTSSQKTMARKLQDIALASTMERRLTKDQILELYLNQVYFGEGAHGIGAAAKVYFNKPIAKLTLAEAAMLARCVRRPSVDNPVYDYDRSMRNKEVVLGIMRDESMIDDDQYKVALADKPKLNPNPPRTTAQLNSAPYFVQHVLAVLKQDLPGIDLKDGGYRIETTLDARLQSLAEQQTRQVVSRYRRMGVTTGAFVLVDGEGRILCEVGGVDFDRNQFDAIWQGEGRQTGSAFKPFVYAAALASGALGYGDKVDNSLQSYWDGGSRTWYRPHNHGGSGGHWVDLEYALKKSLNQAAVNTLAKTGIQTVVGYARDTFGISARRFRTVSQYSYSLALGTYPVTPLEMAEAYSVFMLKGDRVEPRPILRVIGPDGEVVKRYDTVRYRGVLDPNVVATIDGALREVVEGGTGTLANIVPGAHGKTGTTQEGRDAWFCGYSTNLVGISWVSHEVIPKKGSPRYLPMPDVYGGSVPIQIWSAVMKAAYQRYGHTTPNPTPSDEQRPQRSAPSNKTDQGVDSADVYVPPLREAPLDDPGQGQTRTPKPPTAAPDDGGAAQGNDLPPDTTDTNDNGAAPPTPPDTTAKRTKPRTQQASDMVEVQICADSGMRASIYCPETVPKLFPRNRVPKKICTIHGRHGE